VDGVIGVVAFRVSKMEYGSASLIDSRILVCKLGGEPYASLMGQTLLIHGSLALLQTVGGHGHAQVETLDMETQAGSKLTT
jgi:hypothetical protein